MVVLIREVDVAERIDGEVARAGEHGLNRRTAIAGVTASTGTGDGTDDAVGSNYADPIVEQVGDKEVAVVVQGESGGKRELRLEAGPPSPAEPLTPVPANVLICAPPAVARRIRLLK